MVTCKFNLSMGLWTPNCECVTIGCVGWITGWDVTVGATVGAEEVWEASGSTGVTAGRLAATVRVGESAVGVDGGVAEVFEGSECVEEDELVAELLGGNGGLSMERGMREGSSGKSRKLYK